ncbi:MAG TPA: aspartate/glutamate racemase family protein [Smithella sp.]|nr:aspartate/glutamate racemase family protein [Smithella sp.]
MNSRLIRGYFCNVFLMMVILISGCAGWNAPNIAKDSTGIQGPSMEMASEQRPIKTIGIIGGVSWASSIEYYRLMNEMVRDRLGGVNSAQILMFSIEFGEFSKQERMADKGDWTLMTQTMLDAAQRLKLGGADFIVIASNTLNSLGDLIEKRVGLPVLNIADATGRAIQKKGMHKVALLGTKYTMEQPFYRERLKKYGIEVIVPDEKERNYINTVIFDELCADRIKKESKERFKKIINRLKSKGAEGVILGCTEIPLLIKQKDVSIPVFDTTAIHAQAAVDYSLGR